MEDIGGTIVTVDIGTSSVTIIISKINKFNKLDVVYVDTKPIEQLKKGEIEEPYKIAEVIKTMFKDIEEKCGMVVKSAYVNIPNKYVKIEETIAQIPIASKIKTVEQYDINKLFNVIKDMEVQNDLKVIDIFPTEYYNDADQVIESPIHVNTTKLKLKAQVVLGYKPYLEKLEAIMQYSKVKLDGVILQSYSTAKLALDQTQMQEGTLLIDIGGSTTDISVYYKNTLIYIDSLDVGGYNVTSDLSIVLDIGIEEAEKLKKQYALCLRQYIQNNIDVNVLDNTKQMQTIKTSNIVDIIQARCEETLEIINEKLEEIEIKDYITNVVIIGQGFGTLNKVELLCEQKLGRPTSIYNLNQAQSIKPINTTAYSMQEYVLGNNKNINNQLSVVEESQEVKRPEVFSKIFERLRDFLYT